MFEKTMTPYQYAYQNPVRYTDPTGMEGEECGPIKPPQSVQGSTVIYGLKLGNADKGYQDFASSLSSEDLFNVVNSIYDQKMIEYTGGVGQALYGLDSEGNVAVPESIREKVWRESESLMPSAVKDYWTSKQTGLDPTSLSFSLNPFAQIQWNSTRALAVTSNGEALGMIGETAFESAAAYLGGGRFQVGRGAVRTSTSGLETFGSLTEKFGAGYESFAVTQGKHLPIELGQKLNAMSPGSWSKIYEAGFLNGSKVEVHYFYNATTGQYVNPFIKMGTWGSKAFRGLK